MTHRSAGIACHYDGEISHGYAIRQDPDGLLLCEECADEYDNMADAIEAYRNQTNTNQGG